MRFSDHWRLLLERKNFYYSVPSDKELLLYDFYALETLEHYARQRFNPNDLEGSLAGYDEDAPEMVSLQDARKKLIPSLKEDLLDAMLVSMSCEMRHTGSSMLDTLNEEYRDVFKFYFKEMHLNKHFKEEMHPSKRHRPTKSKPTDWTNRKASVKAMNKTVKKYGKARTVAMIENAFVTGSWTYGYGGRKWGSIAECWLKLYEAETLPEMTVYIDRAYDLQHNNGSVFNKIQDYMKDGSYSWLGNALDKKYEVLPWELVDNASSTIKNLGRKVLQKARVSRNNNPDDWKAGDRVEYIGDGKVKNHSLTKNKVYYIHEVNPLYGKISVVSDPKNTTPLGEDLISKFRLEAAAPEAAAPTPKKWDGLRVGDVIKFVGDPATYDDSFPSGSEYTIEQFTSREPVTVVFKTKDSTIELILHDDEWEKVETKPESEPPVATSRYSDKPDLVVGDMVKINPKTNTSNFSKVFLRNLGLAMDEKYKIASINPRNGMLRIYLKNGRKSSTLMVGRFMKVDETDDLPAEKGRWAQKPDLSVGDYVKLDPQLNKSAGTQQFLKQIGLSMDETYQVQWMDVDKSYVRLMFPSGSLTTELMSGRFMKVNPPTQKNTKFKKGDWVKLIHPSSDSFGYTKGLVHNGVYKVVCVMNGYIQVLRPDGEKTVLLSISRFEKATRPKTQNKLGPPNLDLDI